MEKLAVRKVYFDGEGRLDTPSSSWISCSTGSGLKGRRYWSIRRRRSCWSPAAPPTSPVGGAHRCPLRLTPAESCVGCIYESHRPQSRDSSATDLSEVFRRHGFASGSSWTWLIPVRNASTGCEPQPARSGSDCAYHPRSRIRTAHHVIDARRHLLSFACKIQ